MQTGKGNMKVPKRKQKLGQTCKQPKFWMYYLTHAKDLSQSHRRRWKYYGLNVFKHNPWPIIDWVCSNTDTEAIPRKKGLKIKTRIKVNKQTKRHQWLHTTGSTNLVQKIYYTSKSNNHPWGGGGRFQISE